MDSKVRIKYEFIVKDENEAIDIKNKIIANTIEGEEAVILFRHAKTF